MKPKDQRLTSEQVGSFVKLIGLTRDREFDCGECVQHLGEFAERQLLGPSSLDEAIAGVEHHLSVCPECREEWLALMRILKADE